MAAIGGFHLLDLHPRGTGKITLSISGPPETHGGGVSPLEGVSDDFQAHSAVDAPDRDGGGKPAIKKKMRAVIPALMASVTISTSTSVDFRWFSCRRL
jgi:hypothetical protein